MCGRRWFGRLRRLTMVFKDGGLVDWEGRSRLCVWSGFKKDDEVREGVERR